MVAVGMPTLSSALAACPAGPTSPPRLAGAMVVPLDLSLPCDSMRIATAVACALLCTRLLLRSSLGMAASSLSLADRPDMRMYCAIVTPVLCSVYSI
jgi:hypothetical protein